MGPRASGQSRRAPTRLEVQHLLLSLQLLDSVINVKHILHFLANCKLLALVGLERLVVIFQFVIHGLKMLLP